MSTTYYIANRKRKKECEEFKKFWEEEWFPEITDKLYQFCTGTNGEIVNKDLAETPCLQCSGNQGNRGGTDTGAYEYGRI